MLQAAQAVYKPAPGVNGGSSGGGTTGSERVPLQTPIVVRNITEEQGNEEGWLAVAAEIHGDGSLKYVVVKGKSQATVDVAQLRFM
jgi:hypothetical protein